MWTKATRLLKHTFPAAHQYLKSSFVPAIQCYVGFSLPRRIGGNTIWVHPRLLTAAPPEPHVIRWVCEGLYRGQTFFDVGAHYGWIAMAGARRVGQSGRVFAFEASPILLDILAHHKHVNRLPQLQIVRSAVSDTDRESVPFFLLNDGLSFRNSLTIGANDTPFVTVEEKTACQVNSVTLDRFVSDSGVLPDLIKIDVEGAELLVLQGAQRILARHKPALILGVHPYWLPPSQSPPQIFELLDSLDYEIKDQKVVPFQGGYVADYLCTQRRTKR